MGIFKEKNDSWDPIDNEPEPEYKSVGSQIFTPKCPGCWEKLYNCKCKERKK